MDGLMLRLHQRDERVLSYVIGRRRPRLDKAVRRLTHLGGATASCGTSTLLLLGPVDGWHDAGRAAAVALAASHLAVQLLKRTVARPRPQLPVGVGSLVDAPDRFSFPSGHAAAALSIALGLALLVPLMLAPAVLGAGLVVGLTRCYLGVHYPGDVIAGWVLAALAFAAWFSVPVPLP
jgi:undecaprenyl-diphosphatase